MENFTNIYDKEKWYIVRCNGAGVFIAHIKEATSEYYILTESRRIWEWYGANDLSYVAVDGVDVEKSKISREVEMIVVANVVEVNPCTEKAAEIIRGIKPW